jgi:hypothetical protein
VLAKAGVLPAEGTPAIEDILGISKTNNRSIEAKNSRGATNKGRHKPASASVTLQQLSLSAEKYEYSAC